MDRRRWIVLLAGILVALVAGSLLMMLGDGDGEASQGEYYWTPDHHASYERIAR